MCDLKSFDAVGEANRYAQVQRQPLERQERSKNSNTDYIKCSGTDINAEPVLDSSNHRAV